MAFELLVDNKNAEDVRRSLKTLKVTISGLVGSSWTIGKDTVCGMTRL